METQGQGSQTIAKEAERTPTDGGDKEDDDEEAHAEGIDNEEDEEPIMVTVDRLIIPSDYRQQLLRGNDSDTGHISEAESNRSETSYVNVRHNATRSRRSWLEENTSD